MGKIEELIEKQQNRIVRNKHAIKNDFSVHAKSDLELCNEMLEGFITDLQQLKSSLPTQQDKVVVPQCVDKFLSVGNKSQKLACLVSCKYSILTCDMAEGELKQWLREISMDDLLSLANGYTVEKELLYYVEFINDGDVHKRLVLDHENDKYNIVDWSDNLIGIVQEMFTESEIIKVNSDFMTFAVPVEEESQ